MPSKSNGKMPSHQDRARSLADELEGIEDEISEVTANHTITVNIDQTGKFPAMPQTVPDNPRPKQDSLTERAFDAAPELVERVKTKEQAWVAIAIVVALAAVAIAWLRWG